MNGPAPASLLVKQSKQQKQKIRRTVQSPQPHEHAAPGTRSTASQPKRTPAATGSCQMRACTRVHAVGERQQAVATITCCQFYHAPLLSKIAPLFKHVSPTHDAHGSKQHHRHDPRLHTSFLLLLRLLLLSHACRTRYPAMVQKGTRRWGRSPAACRHAGCHALLVVEKTLRFTDQSALDANRDCLLLQSRCVLS